MQHFILTRLAVGKPSQEWLAWRLYLFQHFCAPSVAAQTNRNFRWILAVNPTAPTWFMDGVLSVAVNAAIVHHTKSTSSPDWPSLVRPFIMNLDTIVTTRFDSDDMLHRNFVEYVQRAAKRSVCDEVIDCPAGLKVRLSDYAYIELSTRNPIHFISLVEHTILRNTVYAFHHYYAYKYYPIRIASTDLLWAEICHGTNVANLFISRKGAGFTSYEHLLDYMTK